MERPAHASRQAPLIAERRRAPTRAINAALHRLAAFTNEPGAIAMNQLANLPERAMHVAGQVGDGIRSAMPRKALQWVETGAALTALKTGGRVATRLVKRNPAIAVAAVAGAGLLWLAARRRAKRSEETGGSDGRKGPRRVEARRVESSSRRAPRKRASAT